LLGQFKNCSWVKVVNRRQTVTGWIPGGNRYVRLLAGCDALPFGTFRPFTGVVKPNSRSGGYGRLLVDNGTASDAAVILTLDELPVMAVYIRSGEAYTMKGIRDGTYRLYFSTGSEWNGKQFTSNPSYKRFEDAFTFRTTSKTYTEWSATLHPVAGGTASVEEVDPDEFPEIEE